MPPHSFARQTLGIILAAGRGRRMGCLKQTLPWGDSTIIAHVYDALLPHCAAGIAVVVGSHGDEIIAALHDRQFSIVQSDTNAQQYESICRGLDCYLNETDAPLALIQPADHPFIPAIVVKMLFDNMITSNQQGRSAVIPTFQNRGGHPVLIPRAVAADILRWRQTVTDNEPPNFQGIKTFWQEHPDLIQRIETNQPTILTDLDIPADYQQHHP